MWRGQRHDGFFQARALDLEIAQPGVLGEQVFSHFLANKKQEWRDYRAQVTPYELSRLTLI